MIYDVGSFLWLQSNQNWKDYGKDMEVLGDSGKVVEVLGDSGMEIEDLEDSGKVVEV